MNDDLILNNINLVYYVLQKMNLYNQQDYYYDIGLFGLVKAANNYDPSKGYQFSSFAVRCIKNEILIDIRSNKKYNNNVSLYSPISNDDNDGELIDIISSDFDIEEDFIEKEQKELLHKVILMLSPKEQELLNYYYNDDIKMTQTDIAKKYNIAQSLISRKIKKIIKKLQKNIKEYEGGNIFMNKDIDENTCLHCGSGKPAYCESCYQELIGKNAKLQKENNDLEKEVNGVEEDYQDLGKEKYFMEEKLEKQIDLMASFIVVNELDLVISDKYCDGTLKNCKYPKDPNGCKKCLKEYFEKLVEEKPECDDKEWMYCRVEKMGCEGCYYNKKGK